MNVKVLQIEFSSREVIKHDDKFVRGSIIDGTPQVTNGNYTKDTLLVLHVTFEYESLVGEVRAGVAISPDDFYVISRAVYENGNCKEITRNSIPKTDELLKKAQDLAEAKAQSLVNEESLLSYNMNYLEKIKSVDLGLETIFTPKNSSVDISEIEGMIADGNN